MFAQPRSFVRPNTKHKNKQIVQPERPKKRASFTEKNLKKTKSVKVSILATKMNKPTHKTIAKNKASRELHIQSQNAKKMYTNTQIHFHI